MEAELSKIFNQSRKNPDHPLHAFHSYPCKFPAFIPREIVKRFAEKGDVICDPFVGSGTTLLESSLLGHSSIGNDINPLSCFLSKVKAKPISKKTLSQIDIFLDSLLDKYEKSKNIYLFEYDGVDHWFQKNVIKELSFLRAQILEIDQNDLKDLMLAIFSSIIVKVSNQESDTRYAAIRKNIFNLDTIKCFINKAKSIKKIYIDFNERARADKLEVKIFNMDSRNLSRIKDSSVDMVITSPPYANTYDYYLYHKHRKFWLGMDVKYAQSHEIGSRREFSSLKEDPLKWKEDIKKCLSEIKRITKPNKKIFIIIGDSIIKNEIIKMDSMIKKLSKEVGLDYMACASSPLSKHSRMFNPKFSSAFQKEEHLILLRKPIER